MKTTRARWRAALWTCCALALAACGGGGPPDQDGPAARTDVQGTALAARVAMTARFAVETSAKGAAGLQRVANNVLGSSDYAVSVSELTPPYVLSALVANETDYERVYGLALSPGVANLTPLTSLLVAQVFGQDPAAVFSGFGPAAGPNLGRATPASVAAAQRQLKAFIQEQLGIVIPAAAGDLIAAPFRPVAGDPMFDSIAAVTAKLDADGETYQAFGNRVAAAARLCLNERLGIERGGQTVDFCPQSKSATPRDGDETLIDYLFVDRHGDRLAIEVRNDVVLNARYEVGGAAPGFQCSGAGCSGIALGPVAADLSRPIVFGPATLQGAAGAAVLSGALGGAIPGIALPVLPCDNNRFTLVLPDRSVVAKCVDPDPLGFGIGGTLNSLLGVAPSRAQYKFVDTGTPDNTLPQLSVLTDANDRVISVEFTDNAPDTYTPRRRFVCHDDGCNGVSLGSVTVNVDVLGPDYPVLLRTVTFDGTVLAGYTAAGEATGTSATLRASVVTAYLADVTLAYRAPGGCPVGLPVAATAGGVGFNACVQPAGDAFELPDSGDILLSVGNYETDVVQVILRNGAVASASLQLIDVPGPFICSGGCPGIVVTAPDAGGRRSLRFDGALLHEQYFGAVEGPRSITLSGGVFDLAPQVPLP